MGSNRHSHSLPFLSSIGIVLATVLLSSFCVDAIRLHTYGRWIVNESGKRVKLACVNWVSSADTSLAEGLSHQPIDFIISKGIKSLGFNCVRLTWPLHLITNETLASLTVRQSFENLGLQQGILGIEANNPSIIDLPLLKAFQAVVKSLGDNNVMVILDNHLTRPGWCCSNTDGNGFFGDQYFDPDLWITGLTKMATLFNGVHNVVGMSLRNELRGPKQNVPDWFRYMPKGAEAVHAANPNVLVILSGLNFDLDLSFLKNQSVNVTFPKKLVFEVHQYSFDNTPGWVSENRNQVCGEFIETFMNLAGYLVNQGWPLFLSEFGVDQRGGDVSQNRFFNCFLPLIADLDLDWALWALTGDYYIREGVVGLIEYYGVLDANWSVVRNASFEQKISPIQLPYTGPGLSETKPYKVIYHPLTGLCVTRTLSNDTLSLGPCSSSNGWEYTAQKTISLKGTKLCLQGEGEGKQATLGTTCLSPNSTWDMISNSKLHLSYGVNNVSSGCLDVDINNIVVTNTCKCLTEDSTCEPASQWFKLLDSTRKLN